jgi:ribonuclease R
MSKAKYSINNLGHFGLALKNYTHYTSPIRRYPDLLVNRILWMFLFDKNSYTDDERQQLISHLNEFCQISSNKEIISIECERKVKSMKFAEFMSTKIGNVFKGFVSSVSPYGAFVQLSNTIEGLICMSNFKNDFYVFNSELNQLIGSKTSQVIRIGT